MRAASKTKSIVAASAFLVGSVAASKAQDTTTFVIAAASGYGVEDCLGQGGECGQVVADAWCQAHGQGAALKFGQDLDRPASPVQSAPYFITCAK
jgi:hypothetical protein